MATSPADPSAPTADPTQPIQRRGLLAAAVALVVGLVAKLSEERVDAGVDGDVVPGTTTSAATTTVVRMNSAYSNSGAALLGLRDTTLLNVTPIYRMGVYGYSSSTISAVGVFGEVATSTNGIGVQGFGGGSGSGVFGLCPAGTGVLGRSTSATGVRGESTSGVGVFGEIPASSDDNTIAIYARNYSTYTGSGPGAGGFAIYGLCAKGHGLVGATAAAGAAAVVGATNGVAGAYAAAFYGPVLVGGDLTVFGAKSAAVPHPDGSHRRVYCLESPESWFEDFGTGQLACGRADIALDSAFASIVSLDDYQVFVTEYDQHSDLCVTERTATGFRVQARDVAATGRFGWRVVAKRRDIAGERLAIVTVPPEPVLPPIESPLDLVENLRGSSERTTNAES